MSQDNKICKICHTLGHSKFYCKKKPLKPIKRAVLKGFGKLDGTTVNVIFKTTKPKKPSRSKIKKDLDKLVKDYVKERDQFTCQRVCAIL